jgi:hypothetical protein
MGQLGEYLDRRQKRKAAAWWGAPQCVSFNIYYKDQIKKIEAGADSPQGTEEKRTQHAGRKACMEQTTWNA